MPATRYKHVIVIGRLFGDDEDTAVIFHNSNLAEAHEAFEEEMRADLDEDVDPESEHNIVYINHTIYSQHEIHLDSTPN